MKARKILSEIEDMHYWDARVLKFDSSFFGDEMTLVYEDTERNVELSFTGCTEFSFHTTIDDRRRPIRELARSQIPYFLQDIDITDVECGDFNLLKCKILMPPLNVEIVCNFISVVKI
ncbi:hypothetical protein J45TS6_47950 [Paenibacillus sp. J45TS6]|uniref:hypothetical protein n=1 Tax=unclassified Paenibacillus TaxID=185978 RepID=UPI001B1A12DE|nr:hypothetical protein [Paenibacillus sp. J45TS6]GIP46336.1 hypothetical protein J45TS6_47950 [Paenibacillus sp. J45TS6]